MSVLRKLGVSAVATVIGLAFCEVGARAVFPAPPDPTRQPQIVYRVDPQIRYVLMPNQRGWVDDGFVTTNSRGFRGREVDVPKPKGRFRIIALGDSVTFGWGVNDAETFCSQLEEQLRAHRQGLDVEVINLAVPGYATRQEVALLERNLADLQPDVVLVGFYTNDLPDTLDDKASGQSGTRIVAAKQDAGQVLHMNPAPSSWLERQARRSRAVYTATHGLKGLIHRGEGKPGSSMELDLMENRQSAELETAWRQVSSQLDALKDLSSEYGFAAGIVVLPPREQVLGLYGQSDYQKHVARMADQFGLFVIDPLPSLAGSSDKKTSLFIAYDRNHPSATGHRVIARSIADYFNGHEDVMPGSRRFARSERAQ